MRKDRERECMQKKKQTGGERNLKTRKGSLLGGQTGLGR